MSDNNKLDMREVLPWITFIIVLTTQTPAWADTPTPTITSTIAPTATPTLVPMPKPYMFYLEVPLIIDAQIPAFNITAFNSGWNDAETKYLYIVLTEDGDDDENFRQWIYAIVRDSPLPVVMIEVGNNTADAHYDFVRPLIQ